MPREPMAEDPRRVAQRAKPSLMHRWSPIRATAFAVGGAFLAARAVFADASASTFEFWVRIIVGVALVVFGLLDLRHHREVRESRSP